METLFDTMNESPRESSDKNLEK